LKYDYEYVSRNLTCKLSFQSVLVHVILVRMMAHVLLTVTMRPHVPVKENGVVVTVQVSLYFLHFKLPGKHLMF